MSDFHSFGSCVRLRWPGEVKISLKQTFASPVNTCYGELPVEAMACFRFYFFMFRKQNLKL